MGWAKFFSCSSLPSFFFFFYFFYVSSCITVPPAALLCIAVSEYYYYHHNTNYCHHSCHPHHRRYCTKPSPVVSHQRLYSATFLRTRRGEKKHRQRNTLTRLRRGRHEAQRRGGGGRGGRGCYEISFNPLVPSLALLPAVVAPFSPVWPCLNGVRPWKI